MHSEQQQAILVIAVLAAFADGSKHDRERDAIRRIADSLAGAADAPDLARLYQDVLLRRTSLEQAVARLESPELRHLAYEMAVSVCNADDRESETERAFLADLRGRLGLDQPEAARIDDEVSRVVAMAELAAPRAGATAAALPVAVSATPDLVMANVSAAEMEQTILNYALIAGALELLPQSWASLAIVPLQVKLVYVVGQAHGQSLDQGQIKDFIATAGVGLTSQYLEQFGRKLLGGLLGKVAGKSFGKLGSAASGMAFSFATTWALGQVARRYYAGGRKMDVSVLRESFQGLLDNAKQMQTQYLPQIQERARTLDMTQVMNLVRGR
ncbi:MAG TPA: GTPase [Gammaproteobacteria bacterium]|nr:GTPase [Gammaproteobacteria bacterium]